MRAIVTMTFGSSLKHLHPKQHDRVILESPRMWIPAYLYLDP
ncbi:hypothetical protein CEXT_445141, partial [Caerostris extrusa]